MTSGNLAINNKVFLLGFMCSGKTTVGKRLAKSLDFAFMDLDAEIEKRHKTNINDIFEKLGEQTFRLLEREMLLELIKSEENTIISLGGGTPCQFDNMDLIKQYGLCVLLDISPIAVLHRYLHSKEERPLLKNKSEEEVKQYIETTLEQRRPFYLKADIIYPAIDVDIKMLAFRISEALNVSN
jgi:shikimate kinase